MLPIILFHLTTLNPVSSSSHPPTSFIRIPLLTCALYRNNQEPAPSNQETAPSGIRAASSDSQCLLKRDRKMPEGWMEPPIRSNLKHMITSNNNLMIPGLF